MNRQIPIDFILSKRKPTCAGILLGLEEGWISKDDGIQLTQEILGCSENVLSSLKQVAQKDAENDHSVRLYWLNIILSWVYEKRNEFDDPLGIVESIYADFDYPEEIKHLIRYNVPLHSSKPSEIGYKNNELNLFNLWQKYLDIVFS